MSSAGVVQSLPQAGKGAERGSELSHSPEVTQLVVTEPGLHVT